MVVDIDTLVGFAIMLACFLKSLDIYTVVEMLLCLILSKNIKQKHLDNSKLSPVYKNTDFLKSAIESTRQNIKSNKNY